MVNKKTSKSIKKWIAVIIMIISTSVIIFNNVGQSFQLMQLDITKNTMYWVAGFALVAGALWVLYLDRVLRQ